MHLNLRFVSIIAIVGLTIYWLNTDKMPVEEQATATVSENQKNIKPPSTRELYLQSITELNLSDKELEKCLIKEFNASRNKLSNVSQLKKLSCHADKIMFLGGIQALSELESIIIIGSDIQDATPLASLNSLEKIYLKGGNAHIRNIRALTQLPHLKKITFPHMLHTYCYEAEAVLKSMKKNIDGPTSNNLNLVHCRGKKNAKVIRALGKLKRNEHISLEEEIALNDYKNNLKRSKL